MNAPILSNLRDAKATFHSAALPDLPLGGITPFTTIDFPGRLAAVFYTQGCLWRCLYCHNSHLWPTSEGHPALLFSDAVAFLETRKGLLDGVVFSGGEPALHPLLGPAMKVVREMGFQVGLHTSGMFPERLREVLGLCDWVGMDVKAPFDRYPAVTQAEGSGACASESLNVILKSGVDYEIRTTVHPGILADETLVEMGKELSRRGVRNYCLQSFRPMGCVNEKLNSEAPPPGFISCSVNRALSILFKSFQIRE